MSDNGIKNDFKSTIVVMFKAGGNVTTKCKDEPNKVREDYEKARTLASDKGEGFTWRVITGDEDNSVAYYNVNEIAFVAIQNYVDEETAAKRLKTKQEIAIARQAEQAKGRQPLIVTPGPRRM